MCASVSEVTTGHMRAFKNRGTGETMIRYAKYNNEKAALHAGEIERQLPQHGRSQENADPSSEDHWDGPIPAYRVIL
jgi:hypothetical protein